MFKVIPSIYAYATYCTTTFAQRNPQRWRPGWLDFRQRLLAVYPEASVASVSGVASGGSSGDLSGNARWLPLYYTYICCWMYIYIYMGMDQYLLIPFLVGWHTAIYVYMYIYRWMDGWIDRKGSQSRQVEAPAGNSWRQERSESLPEHQRRELGPQLR